jgi:Leucine-rich repeat (LRR) protein
MISLKKLKTIGPRRISDVSFLNKLKKLEDLTLNQPQLLKEINLYEPLLALKRIDLNYAENLENLSFLKWVPNLEYLTVNDNDCILSIEAIAVTSQLKYIELSDCKRIQSYQSISNNKFLETLKLNCNSIKKLDIDFEKLPNLKEVDLSRTKINNLGNIFAAQNLNFLDVSNCEKLVQLTSIDKMSNLEELDVHWSPNIRNLDKLVLCKNLLRLETDDPVNTIQILMSCAVLRCDVSYVKENIAKWIENINLSKDPITYISRLLNCLSIIKTENYQAILQSSISMRARGLQSDELNDLDANTWETWCNLVFDLDKTGAISCLHAAIYDINIEQETEVIFGPVIMATAALIEKYPEEKEELLAWVQGQLQQLENHPKEQHRIAPSAALFFASLNKQDDVLFWLQKATDEKVPLWRERVLHALVKYYAHKENFAEARRLLDEMQIQDVKDHAISALAQAMAASHPVEAGFMLDEIQEDNISIEAARKLLQQPTILSAPQGIYQLLLHLQSNPDELASALEIIIERDTDGRIAEAVKQLFIQAQASGSSAAVLLELCKHPSISDFVKPRALEKYKSELQERANRELSQSIPHLIAEMQNAVLLEEDEAEELIKLMQTT